jgi:hypothetical protein
MKLVGLRKKTTFELYWNPDYQYKKLACSAQVTMRGRYRKALRVEINLIFILWMPKK